MISKEKFVNIFQFIQKQNEKENKFCEILEDMSPGSYCDAFIFNDYQNMLISVVKDAMDLPEDNDDIEYFMCDLDWGNGWEPGMITTKDGTDIKLATLSDLYDYLISANKEVNRYE